MNEFDEIWVWDDAAVRAALGWYLGIDRLHGIPKPSWCTRLPIFQRMEYSERTRRTAMRNMTDLPAA